jgi:hypothetical protein
MTQDEIKVLELEALIEDLRLNHECCPKEVILQAADELERLSQRTEQNFCPRCGKRTNDIHTCTPPQGIYYTPPQRTWVGLTNDELTDLFYNTNLGQQSAVAQAIALLEEKNT